MSQFLLWRHNFLTFVWRQLAKIRYFEYQKVCHWNYGWHNPQKAWKYSYSISALSEDIKWDCRHGWGESVHSL